MPKCLALDGRKLTLLHSLFSGAALPLDALAPNYSSRSSPSPSLLLHVNTIMDGHSARSSFEARSHPKLNTREKPLRG